MIKNFLGLRKDQKITVAIFTIFFAIIILASIFIAIELITHKPISQIIAVEEKDVAILKSRMEKIAQDAEELKSRLDRLKGNKK